MGRVVIVGAGAMGSAIAQRLAERNRVREIVFVDEAPQVAAGKALDIRQSGPIGRYDTALSATADVLAASSGDVIVIADDSAGGEWEGERGLALVQRLVRAGVNAPLVFAGPKQTWLMEAAVREARVPSHLVVGTAAAAVPTIVRSLVHIDTGLTGAVVTVAGRPPKFVPGWSAATIGGLQLTNVLPAHRLLAIAQSLSRFWPPGPQAIAAPTALVVEALISGSRQPLPGLAILEEEFGARGAAGLVLLELGHGRIQRRMLPTLSPQESTEAGSAIHKR
jgi:malate dehydrogenase